MLKALIIGASEEAIHAIKLAKKRNIYVIVVDGNKEAAGLPYGDKAIVSDISDLEAICKVVEKEKPDFVIPVPIGRYLIAMGYINEKYGFKGVGYQPVQFSTDKFLFHNKLKEIGLRKNEVLLLTSGSSCDEYKGQYPAIAKPRYGSGNRDVFFLGSKDELDRTVKMLGEKTEDFLVEEMVTGIEYGIDAVVINGDFKLLLLRKKTLTPLPARQATSYTSVFRESQTFQRVDSYMKNVVQNMGYDNCVMHADILVNKAQVFVIEMSPRPSGHYLHDIFLPNAIGIDMLEEFIKFLSGDNYCFDVTETKCVRIQYFDFENVMVKKVPDVQCLKEKCNLLEWKCNIHVNDILEEVINGHSLMYRGYFIVQGSDEDDLVQQCEYILHQFEMEDC